MKFHGDFLIISILSFASHAFPINLPLYFLLEVDVNPFLTFLMSTGLVFKSELYFLLYKGMTITIFFLL